MEISYLGHSSFKIKTKSATIVTDPYSTKSDADIVTISHDHFDHNVIGKITGYKKVLSGPGEYEVSGVSIIGYPSYHDDKRGEARGKNTIYVYEADGLNLCHLGDLGHALTEELVSEIGNVDILMIPVGGEFTIGPREAVEVVGKIDPYFVIPMHYQQAGLPSESFAKLGTVDAFLKESGLSVENLPKFSVKKEDILEDQSTKVIVLSARN